MIDMLKTIWNNLFNKQPVVVDQEVHPLPTEVEELVPVKPKTVPVKTTTLKPKVKWPFPTGPKPVVEPMKRKRNSPLDKAAVSAPEVHAKKSAKEIAADRRKAAAASDRDRAKGKKAK